MKTPATLSAALLLGAALVSSPAQAEPQVADELRLAVQPLDEGVPEVALVRLRELLTHPLNAADKRLATLKCAEAFIATNQSAEALKLLEMADLQGGSDVDYLRAQAFAASARWSDALPIYEKVAADPASPLRPAATFGAAEARRALGQRDAALQTFATLFNERDWAVRAHLRSIETLVNEGSVAAATRLFAETKAVSQPDRMEKRLLRGRVDLARGETQKAIEALESIIKSQQGVTHQVLISALVCLADAHLRAKTPETGDDALEDFIEDHPADPSLPTVFAKLDELYAAERKTTRRELARWTRDEAQPRKAFAQWYLARTELRAGRRDIALQLFELFRASAPAIPEFAAGLAEFAQLQIDSGKFDDATETLTAARERTNDSTLLARIEMLNGQAQYRAQHFDAAASSFEEAARARPGFAPTAIYNAALSSLRSGNHAQFLVDTAELDTQPAARGAAAELALEQGFTAATRGDRTATGLLQQFVTDHPDHERVSEALVALAELAFHAAPPRIGEARKDLERAAASHPTAAASERADYLSIWIEDADPAKIIKLGNDFLHRHPQSAFTPDVRMKLAETYFRRQDFPNAQTQFELLARENPNGPLAEKALFFAGESAMSSMAPQSLDRAIVLLDQVVKKDGELKWTARNEQAAIERKLGKEQDALLLYDEVLKNSSKPAERREALCGKGDIYSATATADRENYKRAIEAFDQLASDRETTPHWRNQALFKEAVCLEKLEDRDRALATYYSAIEDEGRPDRPREFFWFYKAGFSAARLLEEQEKWEGAAAVYQKLSSAGGIRSEEAKARLARLRLEHFLWED